MKITRNHIRRGFFVLVSAIIILVVVVFVGFSSEADTKAQFVVEAAAAVAAVVGAIAIWYQLKKGRDLTEAEFIVNLNASFSSDPDIKMVYGKIEQERRSGAQVFTEDDIGAVVSYLTFFETIYSLVQRRILSYTMIDDLFAYRFFVAAHHPFVQEHELVGDAEYYRNIYALHKGWTAHRDQARKEPFFKERDLRAVMHDYERLASPA